MKAARLDRFDEALTSAEFVTYDTAAFVAGLILTTQTLIAKKPDLFDATSSRRSAAVPKCFDSQRPFCRPFIN